MLVLCVQPLVAMLKVKLGAFGWAEAVRRDAKESQWRGGAAAAAAELDSYLERMGVRCVCTSTLGHPLLGPSSLDLKRLRATRCLWPAASIAGLPAPLLVQQNFCTFCVRGMQ